MRVLRPIGHEEQLSVIDHLDELRSRLIISGVALAVAFCVGFWQNHALIQVLNRALPSAAKTGLGAQQTVNNDLESFFAQAKRQLAAAGAGLSAAHHVPASVSANLDQLARAAGRVAQILPTDASAQAKPVTLGPGESFTTTLLVVGYFALLAALPVLIYQLYAFVLPALNRDERRVAVPTMVAAPVLFTIGVVFTYFAVLPPAIHFLQSYNSQEFQILIQAGTYYKFEVYLMLGIGLLFQVPLLLLALQKAGLVTARTLTLNWRYATVIIAVIAAALPGVDPVTMMLETLPLILLYAASILMLRWVEYRERKRVLAQDGRKGDR
ncbi:MAG: twin-arginine translocase subunit TatC [Solirubrobacteraceae bacterium]